MTFNAALGGLVAITAGCDMVSVFGAAVIGILTGVFAVDGGLLYGGGFSMVITQIIGVASVIAWVAVTMTITFQIIKHTIGLRASAQEEIEGLDIQEHGLASAYADFMPATSVTGLSADFSTVPAPSGTASPDEAVPVQVSSRPSGLGASDVKLTKVTILCSQARFESLKAAMNEIGVTGMTVTQVLGCGIQKGKTEYYRGVAMSMNLLPKVQVDIVVSKVPVNQVIAAAKKALYTGRIGDGKIFVYDVENVVKVRTGEEGYDALQGEE